MIDQCARILNELSELNQKIDNKQITQFIEYIDQANHIFLSGKGRSGLMIQAFANRLMHLGYKVSIVGEISSPHTEVGDLLILSSGSGETKSLISQAQTAKEAGLRILLITTNPNSSLDEFADMVINVPAQSKQTQTSSVQPMGALFEQYTLLLFDGIVLDLMNYKGETNQSMKSRHANIE